MTQEEIEEVEFCKKLLITEIEKIDTTSKEIKEIRAEIKVSIIYLKRFSAYLKEKKYETIEQAWWFMIDIKGINEKIFFVKDYLLERLQSKNPNG